MAYKNERSHSTNRSVGDQIQSSRLQDFNQDLDELFKRLDNTNISLTYSVLGYLTQIVDSANNITVNIDRSDWNSSPVKLYIQEVGDTKKYTITYAGNNPSSIIYA